MSTEAARFSQASEQFVGYYDTVRGHVRQEVTRHNMIGHLPAGRALSVLDFGGGDGRDAVWLAGMGDRVLLLDESPEMLSKAESAAKQAKPDVRKRLTLCHGDTENLEDDEVFDVILSHGVLMYELDDPAGQLQSLSKHLKPGGILSLLTKGHEAARICSEEPDQSAHFNDEGEYINRLGLPTRVYSFDELEDMVAKAGLEARARYGVRILTDGDRRALSEVTKHELDSIIHREIEASRDSAQIERAQMLHVIAERTRL